MAAPLRPSEAPTTLLRTIRSGAATRNRWRPLKAAAGEPYLRRLDVLGEAPAVDRAQRRRPHLDPERLDRTRRLLEPAVADAEVTGYEPLINVLSDLPDPDDRHVLAVALKANAQAIVACNIRDFPAEVLSQWNVEAIHPDTFVVNQLDLNREVVRACVQQVVDSRTNSTFEDVVIELGNAGLAASAAKILSDR